MPESPVLLLTFDVEEFVLPAEAGLPFDTDTAYALGAEGLERAAAVLNRHGVVATHFSTLKFAERHAGMITTLLSEGHELALHAVDHAHDYRAMPRDVARKWLDQGRRGLQQRFGVPVDGYRANRFRTPATSVLRELGFRWTSNLHPTWVPGQYDHRREPRTIHEREGLLEIPVSVTPRLRLPVSWFWMRNLGLAYTKRMALPATRGTGYLNLYVHPWEFADLPRVPGLGWMGRLSTRRTGAPFVTLLDGFLTWWRERDLPSSTISAYLESRG